MNRYWDMTEQQRAAMTRDEVAAFLDVELMEKGIKKLPPLELQEERVVSYEKQEFYEIYAGDYSGSATGIIFGSIEDANAFTKLKSFKKDYNWNLGGSELSWCEPLQHVSVTPVSFPTKAVVMQIASLLKENKAIKDSNEKQTKARAEQISAIDKATKGIWDDWQDCKQKKSRCEQLIATFQEYVGLCDGDRHKALVFLKKVHDDASIQEATLWSNLEDLVDPVVQDTMVNM